jgi:hypothetical protein
MLPYVEPSALVLIKPHPSQDMLVCEHISSVLKQHGVRSHIWDHEAARFLPLEVLFGLKMESIEAVFSPFSSSIFYLSKLFPDCATKFYYSISSIHAFSSTTPPNIRQRWIELEKLIERVYAGNAIDLGQ